MKKFVLLLAFASLILVAAPSVATAQTPVPTSTCGDAYIVRSGDTLREIAQQCGVTVDAIVALNDFIVNPNLIYPGWILDMPGSEAQPGQPVIIPGSGAAATSSALYVVKAGDSIAYIARRLDVSREDLLAANPQVDSNADLYTGQILFLPGAGDTPAAVVSPRVIDPGQIVTIAARGFTPNSEVTIAGGPLGEVEKVMTTVTVNGDGNLRINMNTPMNAERGKRWTFVVRSTGSPTRQARTNLLYVVDTTGPNEAMVYNVRLNDTLSGIAAKFGITVEDIIEANPQIENRNSIILVGQDVLIPGPAARSD